MACMRHVHDSPIHAGRCPEATDLRRLRQPWLPNEAGANQGTLYTSQSHAERDGSAAFQSC